MIDIRPIDPDEAAAFRRPVFRQFAEENGHPFDNYAFAFQAVLDGETVGTADGYVLYGWAYVSFLGVLPEHRKAGVGSRLMDRVEEHAREEGLIGVQLDTFRYQAPDFYAARGYEEKMVLPGRTPDTDRIFVAKRLVSHNRATEP